MKSLFLKIFLSFWVAQALFLILAVAAIITLRPQRDSAAWESLQSQVLAESVRNYQATGEQGLRAYLSGVEETHRVRAFLFNEEGQELSGARPPDWVERVERGQRKPRGLLPRLGPDRFLRQSATADDGHRYTLVMELPPARRVLFGTGGVPGLAILIAVISSGLVCYILARYLTKPLGRLRSAAQQLAAGDLSARAGGDVLRRRDEIGEVVRDFDSMAKRLETMVQAQSRLWNDISHELRSPLARLTVALELARQRSGPEAGSALERMELEADRLNELIGRLLTIARLESGEDGARRSVVNVREVISDVAKDADFEAQARHCRVEVIGGRECEIFGSPALLRSAVENVLRNAIRYTREGTAAQVELECDDQTAIVRVTDSGPGVPEQELDKLFHPFYRVDDARGRQTGGVGLGLAIAERAVRLHGGTIRAANRPEGGLVVEIRLPLVPAGAAKVPAAQS